MLVNVLNIVETKANLMRRVLKPLYIKDLLLTKEGIKTSIEIWRSIPAFGLLTQFILFSTLHQEAILLNTI